MIDRSSACNPFFSDLKQQNIQHFRDTGSAVSWSFLLIQIGMTPHTPIIYNGTSLTWADLSLSPGFGACITPP